MLFVFKKILNFELYQFLLLFVVLSFSINKNRSHWDIMVQFIHFIAFSFYACCTAVKSFRIQLPVFFFLLWENLCSKLLNFAKFLILCHFTLFLINFCKVVLCSLRAHLFCFNPDVLQGGQRWLLRQFFGSV